MLNYRYRLFGYNLRILIGYLDKGLIQDILLIIDCT